jgi:DNA-directed RNA polymerase subunit K/omega
MHGNPQPVGGVEGKMRGGDRPAQQRGVEHVRQQVFFGQQFAAAHGLVAAFIGQADIDPAGEQIPGIPFALAVAEQHQRASVTHGASLSRGLAVFVVCVVVFVEQMLDSSSSRFALCIVVFIEQMLDSSSSRFALCIVVFVEQMLDSSSSRFALCIVVFIEQMLDSSSSRFALCIVVFVEQMLDSSSSRFALCIVVFVDEMRERLQVLQRLTAGHPPLPLFLDRGPKT